MVRTKKKVAVLGRGGDKVVAGNMFYASEAARPALKVLDSMQNIEAPVAASKCAIQYSTLTWAVEGLLALPLECLV